MKNREPDVLSNVDFVVQRSFSSDDFTFLARDWPECSSTGTSAERALSAGRDVVERRLETAKGLGVKLPAFGTHRGPAVQLRLRVLRSTHQHMVVYAKDLRVSLNEITIRLLTRAVVREFGELVLRSEQCSAPSSKHRGRKLEADATDITKMSGTWPQRLPRELHEQIKAFSDREGLGLNQLINCWLVREIALLGITVDIAPSRNATAA